MGLVDTREKREQSKLLPKHLSDLVSMINTGKITKSSAKGALQEIVRTGKSVSDIVSSTGLSKISDEGDLGKIIDEIILQESTAVEQAKQNSQTINYLVGKVMQKTKGKADPSITLNLFKKKIGI
ncbi:MAG: Asp-tRNA(Asn)/Glu-tRNA(Gln) amidotransferase GatCAB subunit B, partial [Thaumarchaeota archaeon]|nr:Asp-tRNA(Asn)/Glu-tRNA(Gln) amidotransferase GatCAB subunit B [Nitrososphaerota archaeon]